MGNFLEKNLYCYEGRRKENPKFTCKKCNLEYYENYKTCPKHKFRKNKKNIVYCKHCRLRKGKGNTLCYHKCKNSK